MEEIEKHVESDSKRSSRPSSFYDNLIPKLNLNNQIKQNNSKLDDVMEAPSQSYSLATTVPQNIITQDLSDRHHPTRNSLRHSRIINKYQQSDRIPSDIVSYAPEINRIYSMAKIILSFITFLGSLMCLLSVWLLIWSPNLRQRDNGYYSAIPVLLSGIMGLIHVCCCREKYPGMRINKCIYFVKVFSISSTLIAVLACLVAWTCTVIHLISLSTLTCFQPSLFASSCICQVSNETSFQYLPITSYYYEDLPCNEVQSVLSISVIVSSILNSTACILQVGYLYLQWTNKFGHTYALVKTGNTFDS